MLESQLSWENQALTGSMMQPLPPRLASMAQQPAYKMPEYLSAGLLEERQTPRAHGETRSAILEKGQLCHGEHQGQLRWVRDSCGASGVNKYSVLILDS